VSNVIIHYSRHGGNGRRKNLLWLTGELEVLTSVVDTSG